MTTLFVTGSGTGIGKTFASCRLLEALTGKLALRAIKPIVTGFDPLEPAGSDTALLLTAQGLPVTAATMAATSPWRYRAPLSVDMAAAREHRPLSFSELVDFCRPPQGIELNLIEGVGGVMAPLDETRTVLDWIAAMGTQVLFVTGSYLASLSHTLTALEALDRRGLSVLAIVVSQSDDEPVPTAESIATLQRFTAGIPFFVMPRDAKANAAELAALVEEKIRA